MNDLMALFANQGYDMWLVGGAVRDQLLGLEPSDYDLLTTAPLEKVLEIASAYGIKASVRGAHHRVVFFNRDNQFYEVTSLRPGETLEENLSLRSATINSMAITARGELIDPHGGKVDLNKGLIRMARPVASLNNDPCRAFVLVKLAARLGFEVDHQLSQAIPGALQIMDRVPLERIRQELEETLLSPNPAAGLNLLVQWRLNEAKCTVKRGDQVTTIPVLPELTPLIDLPQNPRYHSLSVWGHTLQVVSRVPPLLSLRLAALFHDVAKGTPGVRQINKRGELSDHRHEHVGALMAISACKRLHWSRRVQEDVKWLVASHMSFPEPEEGKVKRWVKRLAQSFCAPADLEEGLGKLLALGEADLLAGKVNPDMDRFTAIKEISWQIARNNIFYPSQLQVNGTDVTGAGFQGLDVAAVLKNLVERVQSGKLANSREELLAALYKRRQGTGKIH
ncbi:MAG: CCA tRNA nucleotidyltransferase [Bacillota bacterium]